MAKDTAALRQYNREYTQKRRAKKIENTECTWCKNPREENRSFCADCLERARARAAKRRYSGVCVRCTEPSRDGRVLCQRCADEASQKAKDERAARRKNEVVPSDTPGTQGVEA